MKYLLLGMWWFAIISASGEVAFMEFRTKGACEVTRLAYDRSDLKVTSCTLKEPQKLYTPL
jgi:hypothetical protein